MPIPSTSSLYRVTPLIPHPVLSRAQGRDVQLKMETLQPAGSFKSRGVGVHCQRVAAAGARRLVTSSGGNAGMAVAVAGRTLGLAVTVVVPESTAPAVRDKLRAEGAEVHVHGRVWIEADADARGRVTAAAAYVHPFDHPDLWDGHATLVDELAQQGPRPDRVVVSVGGGGLLCGVVEGLRRNGWGDVGVVAVETEGATSLKAAVEAGQLVTLPAITSVAKTLGASRVAQAALDCTRDHPVEVITVSDAAALRACVRFADELRTLVEPSCGASLAVAYDDHPALAGAARVVVVVCGGVAVSTADIEAWRASVG
ncbi:MAG: pyridoxal-phosphate dependent enzyme [Alphaproteobacteria bacterium]|nr:pyridoxal-phosphate dependent enzyme [Alphaproteobacteria bacterium]